MPASSRDTYFPRPEKEIPLRLMERVDRAQARVALLVPRCLPFAVADAQHVYQEAQHQQAGNDAAGNGAAGQGIVRQECQPGIEVVDGTAMRVWHWLAIQRLI